MCIISYQDVADMNTIVVGKYFNKRGFTTIRLDNNKESISKSSCDWYLNSTYSSFICEVKTIHSVQRGVKTQGEFRKVEKQILSYFPSRKETPNLYYHLHFHSNRLIIPSDKALYDFLNILYLKLVQMTNEGKKLINPVFTELGDFFSLCITESLRNKLEIQFSTYGGLNVQTVKTRIDEAVTQLKSSAIIYPKIARIVVLSFTGHIHINSRSEVVIFDDLEFQGEILWRCIESLLRNHSSLSAIAVMTNQANPHYSIFHNHNIIDIEPLNREVFNDGISIQFNSYNTIPKLPINKSMSIDEFINAIIVDISSKKEPSITADDYSAMKLNRKY